MIWKIECLTGCTYTFEKENDLTPIVCGNCGSKIIRTWKLDYDMITQHLKKEMKKRGFTEYHRFGELELKSPTGCTVCKHLNNPMFCLECKNERQR